MKVLSLFDGISCGRVALDRAGIDVEKYVAFEIETSAVEISKKNYPEIEHSGDVFKADYTQYKGFDLLIGGSPCTYWSRSKNSKAVQKKEVTPEGDGWALFLQYVRALEESECTYFLYENNYRIAAEIVEAITEKLGVEPIMIDSALVSAQTRKRYYWTNIPNVQQPEDKGLTLRDIFVPDESRIKVDERIPLTAVRTKNYIKYDLMNKGHFSQAYRLFYLDGKSPTVPKSRTESKINILLDDSDVSRYKIISPLEVERLQTLPDGYTEIDGVSKTKRFEAVGNGWTVDVIAHILRFIDK